jgi:hypothetical protein
LYKTAGGSREKAARGENSLEAMRGKEGKEEEALKVFKSNIE